MGWIVGILVVVLLLLWRVRRGVRDAAPAVPLAAACPEPVALEIGDTLDLHGVPPRDVGALVDAFLDVSCAQSRRQVKIVHGKGIGVMRRTVHARLAQHPHVLHFADAPLPSGWGATIVELDSSIARPRRTD